MAGNPAWQPVYMGPVASIVTNSIREILQALYGNSYIADTACIICRRTDEQHRESISQKLCSHLFRGLHYCFGLCHLFIVRNESTSGNGSISCNCDGRMELCRGTSLLNASVGRQRKNERQSHTRTDGLGLIQKETAHFCAASVCC